jgi:translation elongation factor EF-4
MFVFCIDYEPLGEQEVDLIKLDIKLNGDPVDALSSVCLRYIFVIVSHCSLFLLLTCSVK